MSTEIGGASRQLSKWTDTCEIDNETVLLSLIVYNKYYKTIELQSYQKGIETAARKNHCNVLDFLLTSHLSLQHLHLFEDIFFQACGNGYVNIVRSLYKVFQELFRDQDVLNRGLNISCQNGNKGMVDLLLHLGADVMAQAEEVCKNFMTTPAFKGFDGLLLYARLII